MSSKTCIENSNHGFLDMKIISRGNSGDSVSNESVGYNNNINGSLARILMLFIFELSHFDSTIRFALSVSKAMTIKEKEKGFV